MNGSGDTSFNYIQVFCFVIIAGVSSAAWSLLDRRRPHYDRLAEILNYFLRCALAIWTLAYGIAKLPTGFSQFPPLDVPRPF